MDTEPIIAQKDIEVFIIDDDKDLSEALGALLTNSIMNKVTVFNEPHALLEAMHHDVRICIVDYMLASDMTGLELIKEVVKKYKHCFFIMLSGQPDMHVVVDFMNNVYGSRYVEKASKNCETLLVYYVKDLIEHIGLLTKIYSRTNSILAKADKLEKLINDEPIGDNIMANDRR